MSYFIPPTITLVGISSALLAIVLLWKSLRPVLQSAGSRAFPLFVVMTLFWSLIQTYLGLSGFYVESTSLPPRLFLIGVAPMLILIATIFILPNSRQRLRAASLNSLILLHVVRIPVEWGLYQLSLHGAVPGAMTFSGRNFDIIVGITAPIVVYYTMRRGVINRSFLITWNIISLLFLANIVFTAITALPHFYQYWGFDRPNIAVQHFPFVLLPTLIVPVVLFAHIAALNILLRRVPEH